MKKWNFIWVPIILISSFLTYVMIFKPISTYAKKNFPEKNALEEIRIAQKQSLDEIGFAYIATERCEYSKEMEIDCPWELDRPHKVDATFIKDSVYYAKIVNRFGVSKDISFDKIQIHDNRILIESKGSHVKATQLRKIYSSTTFRDSVNYNYVEISKDTILLIDDLGNQVIENKFILIK